MNSSETQAVNILIKMNLSPTLSNNPDAQVWLDFSARVMHVWGARAALRLPSCVCACACACVARGGCRDCCVSRCLWVNVRHVCGGSESAAAQKSGFGVAVKAPDMGFAAACRPRRSRWTRPIREKSPRRGICANIRFSTDLVPRSLVWFFPPPSKGTKKQWVNSRSERER